jgi:hypothetical protein
MATASVPQERIALGRLLWVTPLAIAAASIANLIVYAVATALFNGPRQFSYLSPQSIVLSTTLYLVLAAIVYALIGRFAKHPIRTFKIVSAIALLLSFAAPISAAFTFLPPDTPDAITILTLLVMHVVGAVITVGLFTTLARERSN